MSCHFVMYLRALLLVLLYAESIFGLKCLMNERQALLTFKQGLKDNFGMLSTWQEHANEDCCQWKGVHCNNQTGHVEMLVLHGKREVMEGESPSYLSGLINSSLIELQHLTYLNLSQNDFNGSPIPEFIGFLGNLRYLDLSHAGFGGKIPYQLAMLPNLQHLNLHQNYLDGVIPYQLGNLSQLHYLDLGVNHLVGTIPHQLGNLSNLLSLSLAVNLDLEIHENHADAEWISSLSSLVHLDFSSIPKLSFSKVWLEMIVKLPKLKELRLSRCNLSDANLLMSSHYHSNFSSSLSILDLSENFLTSNAAFFWMFNFSSNLRELYLEHNLLEGPIPDGFGSILSSLAYLDLSGNMLKGKIPNSFGSVCNLKWLELASNFLSGEISGLIPNTTSCVGHPLQYLSLSNNKISGTLPDLSMFSSLNMLLISENNLHGSIPESIGLLSSLETLMLQGNSLEGVISESHLTNLSTLRELYLSDNSLVLKFDLNWIPTFQLEYLDLASCKLGPGFPIWLQNQKDLISLDISDAEILGTVPEKFWHLLSKLTYLNMSYNNLRGTIPDLLLKSTNYPNVILESNEFEGSIPSFLLKASKLQLSKNKFSEFASSLCSNITAEGLSFLDLSDNQLTGQLPDCWKHLESFEILDLSNNKLSGEIPSSVGTLTEMRALILRNNSIAGELPSFMKNCTKLVMLDVGENSLSGQIPSWIGDNLQKLVILSLRANHFYGNLPLKLCFLNEVKLLDVSRNNITGEIPSCLKNFTAMTQESVGFGVAMIEFPHWYMEGSQYIGTRPYEMYAFLMWKNAEHVFKNPDILLKSIDLSGNQLTGGIPKEIGFLTGLVSLNFSRNNLTGEITSEIGNLKSLEFLDLSGNQFFGKIPSSLARIDRLAVLNLSNNHLLGKIPIGAQF